jgi:S-adenosylmethionine decarboxylase
MHGLHLTADLYQCQSEMRWLTQSELLAQHCIDAVRAAGLQPVAQVSHTFSARADGDGGVTATVLLAESHLCIHTWPEHRAVTLDVYVCNFGADNSHKAQALMATLVALFAPLHVTQQALVRGARTRSAEHAP